MSEPVSKQAKAAGTTQKIPYGQQFSPKQTPLTPLLRVLSENIGDGDKLCAALADAFFKATATPSKIAANVLIALRSGGYGILDGASFSDFGKQLVAVESNEDQAHDLLAKHILLDLNGMVVVETLKDMKKADLAVNLGSLWRELKQRGVAVSRNSSDLSSMLGWLRKADVLQDYYVNEAKYAALLGIEPKIVDALKGLSRPQVAFLQSMVALNVTDWCPYNTICMHAQEVHGGEVQYNWKEIVKTVLEPLREAGLIDLRKRVKVSTDSPPGRGGKVGDVKPTVKFDIEVAMPALRSLYTAAGFSNIRKIRSESLEYIVHEIEHGADDNARGIALEHLAIRLCQLLELEFRAWRAREIEVTGGAEVDALMDSTRLVYSRWQVQCKVGSIDTGAIAKEVGLQRRTLANVILVVGTKKATKLAQDYRREMLATSDLNIIILDEPLLDRIVQDNSRLVEILKEQAQDAFRVKPPVAGLGGIPFRDEPPDAGQAAILDGPEPKSPPSATPVIAYETPFGKMFPGNSLDVLPSLVDAGVRVKLIMTSPPFALVRKKAYGNEDADRYVGWFEKFIPHFKRILDPSGSLVIDIGGSWIKGLPVKSTYHFKLLLKICDNGFYLAQDFYHYNPAKLPTPAEWVTVRRLRVKDAVNNVFLLTRDPFVEADNRNVLAPYSESMKELLRNGYTPRLRPSGHDISDKFQQDNAGAIPPNLFQFANTASTSHYLRRCEETGIAPHPARFPAALPAFFIKLLTKPGDIVLDPFAGSNVTGEVAESLERHWIAIEMDDEYVKGSRFRFEPHNGVNHEETVPTLPPLAVPLPLFPTEAV